MKDMCNLESAQQKTMISKEGLALISGQNSPFIFKKAEAEITDG